MKRLLLSLAHPDDEAFGSGGLISKYVKTGTEVYYIVGTDGARGTVKPRFIEQYGSVEAVRDAEMNCAAETLGFKDVFKLGYKDSDMMGSPNNNDPACLWQADEALVAEKIGEIIQQIQPQVVVTFDPFGAYGHPDHIFMYRATTRAFHAAKPFKPQKLYYTTFPRMLLRYFIWQMRLKGQNPRKAGLNKDMDWVEILKHGLPITTKINVRDYLEDWNRASACHASQAGPRQMMTDWQQRLFFSQQSLTRVYPEWDGGQRETDLFEGVTDI